MGVDTASDELLARSVTDCRREVEGAVIGCWAWVGGVAPVAPVGEPNIASIVGRSAAPKGVERKSEGRSNNANVVLRYESRGDGELGQERNVPLIHDGIDSPVKNPMQSFVKELQLKSTRDYRRERAAICMLIVITQDMILREEVSEETASVRYKAYLVSCIVIPHLRKVFFENLLIQSSLADVYNL